MANLEGKGLRGDLFPRKLHHDPRVLEILYRIESWLSYAGTPGAAEMVGPEIVHARPGTEMMRLCIA